MCLGLSQSSVPGVSAAWNTSARLNKVNTPLSPPHTHTLCDNSLDQWATTQRHKHAHFLFLSLTDGIQKDLYIHSYTNIRCQSGADGGHVTQKTITRNQAAFVYLLGTVVTVSFCILSTSIARL